MSSGGNLPYQLRPNKAVERLLFVDLLKRLDPFLRVGRRFRYVGFGGPQMEDFRLLHDNFRRMKMVSLELEPEVVKRQKFNGPHTNVAYRLQSSSDFVAQRSPLRDIVVWLDYTKPSERSLQIGDLQSLLRRVRNPSIIKITMNAAASSYGNGLRPIDIHSFRLEKFLREFGRFFQNGLEEERIRQGQFPVTLMQTIESATAEALRDRPGWRFHPLTSAVYADGQTMLTVTGLVGERNEVTNIIQSSEIGEWQFARLTWDNPVQIEVPELTLKERIYINQMLPKHEGDIAFLQRKLRCYIDTDPEVSAQKLRNYVAFESHYPHFGKVAI